MSAENAGKRVSHVIGCPTCGARILPTFATYERAERTEKAEAERDRYAEALRGIRDGIFSGNQAAERARQALALSSLTTETKESR